jgi:glycogen debranching enzyme
MGVEKLDNAVYLIRGLYDLADMARAERDGATRAWARNHARRLLDRFEATWWMPAEQQYADSIDDPPVGGPNNQQQDRHWIGVTPMEAELVTGSRRPSPASPSGPTAWMRCGCASPTATAEAGRTT